MGLLSSLLLGQQPSNSAGMIGQQMPPMGATDAMPHPMGGGANSGLLGQLLFGPGGLRGQMPNGLFGQNGGLMAQLSPQIQHGLLGMMFPQFGQAGGPGDGTLGPMQLPGSGFGTGGAPGQPPAPGGQGMMPGANFAGMNPYTGANPFGGMAPGLSGGAGAGVGGGSNQKLPFGSTGVGL